MPTVGLWVIRCRDSVFYTHICEDGFGHGITELCSVIRNDNIRTTISGKQHIQFFCYGCRFFVMDWNKFWPFSEEITNGKNVLVPCDSTMVTRSIPTWLKIFCGIGIFFIVTRVFWSFFFPFGTCHT